MKKEGEAACSHRARIGYLLYVFSGGIFSLTMPIFGTIVKLEVDLSVFLVMLISLNLLALAKNVLQTLSLLTEQVEHSGWFSYLG